MKEIKISGNKGKGRVIQIDDEDYEELSKYKWYINSTGKYVSRRGPIVNNKQSNILMHRQIMKVSDPKVYIDHIDHNGLNNQRANLRIATHSQNGANKRKLNPETFSSIYKGVVKIGNIWRSSAIKDKKVYYKLFLDEKNAAEWYNEMAIKLWGEYALLNEITGERVKEEDAIEKSRKNKSGYKYIMKRNGGWYVMIYRKGKGYLSGTIYTDIQDAITAVIRIRKEMVSKGIW